MRFRFIGCGDAFGSGGRFNTCFLGEAASGPFLIDCGASSLVALKRFGVDPDAIGTIVISHLHGDHFGGLVFLLRAATLYRQRTLPLTIAGPPGLRQRLEAAMQVLFPKGWVEPETFELSLVELQAEAPTGIGPLRVNAFAAEQFSGAPSYSLRVEADGKAIAYSGDTLWTDALDRAAAGADLFVCEAYSYAKRRGTHIDWQTLRERLPQVTARRTILTHLGPDMLAHLDEISAEFEVAEDGLELEI
jgi:ribonuclease BN (tRNA processing enzyme)